ncbi:unnamed protein product [Amoebophrya sp. A25]|nr:unnamed protein product [Amoebophrya sp. A25]|eukprot:GSA25T00011011001.1
MNNKGTSPGGRRQPGGFHNSAEGGGRGEEQEEEEANTRTNTFWEDDPSERIKRRVTDFFDHRRVVMGMASLTTFVLWGDDLRLFFFTKSADPFFYSLFLCAMLVFFCEFMCNTICKDGYKGGFFFWLDMIATFSLFVDIPWVLAVIEMLIVSSSGQDSGASSLTSTVATVRTARAVRLVRLIRLVRVVKLWTMFRKAKDGDMDERLQQQARNAANAKQAALKRVEASRLGKLLSEMTTRRVVVMVLMMLFVLPFLDASDLDNSKVYGLSLLFWYGRSGCGYEYDASTGTFQLQDPGSSLYACDSQSENWLFLEGWRNLIYLYSEVTRDRIYNEEKTDELLWLRIPNWSDSGKLADITFVSTQRGSWHENAACGRLWEETEGADCPYRQEDLEDVVYRPASCSDLEACAEVLAIARFNRSGFTRETAAVSMVQTCFVCFLLGTMSIQFQNDTQSLVIAPIEKMVNIIKQLAEDPLEPPNLESFEEEDAPKQKNKGPQLETTMLENTILKIGGLLQVGFGEAGAQIIGKNMSSGDGELNIMMPGAKVDSVFGFVDIRQFTDTTECLEEDVMVFVNSIGHIVHKCVHRWSGVANKNIGDAFLVLWKIDQEYLPKRGVQSSQKSAQAAARVSDIADRSLFAFLKVICETRRSERIRAFSNHPRIIKRFGKRHEVQFGLGLHVGWAIEGPIGSDYKVDASYLSPHVNISMKLESGTKEYGVPLLLSEPLYLLLSLKAKQRCRKIDMVSMVGMSKPCGIYTFPMREAVLRTPERSGDQEIGEVWKPQGLEVSADVIEGDGVEFLFIIDRDVNNLQKHIPGFDPDDPNANTTRSRLRKALCHYIAGDWRLAREDYEALLKDFRHDKPTRAVYDFMHSLDFVPPSNWREVYRKM